ncbi:hypothetical protein OSH11_11570 [Kaistia dalseonensis]|uniref:Uncharacterized protein n=1 Tax=Kaistia dalseonensis TaxID=410840 RepID=A0ABU0H6K0_9HYPH|nr:hypothetical protein [Kaistia dalseonensis]MCX5495348.1 hypothetical protein [Kaistia dalseonensis]MDQ0437934.1 hypothetical protein [Kaistia dalseonensis]
MEPAETYADLPEETRRMLEDLRPDEVEFLQKLIRMIMSFGSVGKFLALVGGAIIGLVIGLPMLIDALMRIWSWIPHKGP